MNRIAMQTLQKAAICLFFLGFLTARSYGLGLGTPPQAAVPPVGLSVQNGGTASFTIIDYPNTSGVNFKWLYKGQQITSGVANLTTNGLLGGILLDLAPASILTIKNLNSTNAGDYSVISYNNIGAITNTVSLIVLSTTVTNIINMVASESSVTTAGFHLQLTTPVGSNVVVEASSDLQNWTPIYTNLDSTGSISFMDGSATNYPARYYRARTQ